MGRQFVKLAGQIDEDVALLLREQVAALEAGDGPFELDLTEAAFAGEPALRMVIEELRSLSERLDGVRVRTADPSVRVAFSRSGLSRLLSS